MHEGLWVGDRYRVLEPLAKGGMGTTWVALDTQTDERCVIKSLNVESMTDWKTMELFEREVRVLENLDHPNIPRYIATINLEGEGGAELCYVQELIEGPSLAQKVEGGWHPSEAEVHDIARSILEVLIYLHDRNPPLIHRDIKPQNVVMREDGPVLVDFGAVRDTIRREESFASTVVGTFGYMAPEQLRGHAVPSSDLYALGSTLVFILTHRDPAALPHKRLKIDFRSATNLTPRFAHWLDSLLEPTPEDRIGTAREALAALDRFDEVPTSGPVDPDPFEDDPVADRPPVGSRIRVEEREGVLEIELPAARFSRMDGPRFFRLFFPIFFLTFIAFWTHGVWGNNEFMLFSIAFWLMGFSWAWKGARSFLGKQKIRIGPDETSFDYFMGGFKYKTVVVRSRDIGRAIVHKPQLGRGSHDVITPMSTAPRTRLEVGVKTHDFGDHLSVAENHWVCQKVTQWIRGPRHTLPSFETQEVQEEVGVHSVKDEQG